MVALALVVLAGQPVLAQPPSPADPFFDIKLIGPGVYAVLNDYRKSGSNAGFVIGDDGVLVVDALSSADAARALLAEIRKLTPKPVRYLVNTHYHADHTGGDAVFREAGAVIIAHRNVRGWIHTENIHLFGGDKIRPDMREAIEHLPEPDLVTDKDLTIWLGSRRVDIHPALSHTGGDLFIVIPDAKVAFCGDLLWRRIPPTIVDGMVTSSLRDMVTFESLPDAANTTFVPGHGDLATRVDVKDYEHFMVDLVVFTSEARSAGLKDDALIAAVLPRLKARYDWPNIERAAPGEIRSMDEELAGTKRVPVPAPD